MFLMSPEAQVRAQYFDVLTDDAAEVLQRPEITRRLGKTITRRLLDSTAGAFVPNVRGNTVHIPRAYRDTDQACVLPLLDGDRFMQPGRSAMQPTAHRRAGLERALGLGRHNTPLNLRQRWQASRFIAQTIRQIPKEIRAFPLPDAEGKPSQNPQVAMCDIEVLDGSFLYVTRPIIVMPTKQLKQDPVRRSGSYVHEHIHHLDTARMRPIGQDDYFRPWTELRAYTAQMVILERGIRARQLGRDALAETVVDAVDQLRADFGLKRKDVLDDSFVFNEDLDNLAWEMFFGGAIHF